MKFASALFIAASVLIGCQNSTTNNTNNHSNNQTQSTGSISAVLPVADFMAKYKATAEAQLIDVRTPEEFAAGTVPNAVNIDFYATNFKDLMAKLDKNKPLFVFCKSGGRSAKTAAMCTEMGFKEVYDMDGGYTAWSAH